MEDILSPFHMLLSSAGQVADTWLLWTKYFMCLEIFPSANNTERKAVQMKKVPPIVLFNKTPFKVCAFQAMNLLASSLKKTERAMQF